jgi:hypothetical protein
MISNAVREQFESKDIVNRGGGAKEFTKQRRRKSALQFCLIVPY